MNSENWRLQSAFPSSHVKQILKTGSYEQSILVSTQSKGIPFFPFLKT